MGLCLSDEQGKWTEIGAIINFSDPLLSTVAEHKESYNLPFFDAELIQLSLPDIFIVYGDMRLKKRQIRFRSTNEPDFVELHFSLVGGGIMKNHINGHVHQFDALQHNIIYSPEFDGTGQYSIDKKHQFFEVHFSKNYFLGLVADSGDLLSRFCEKVDQHHFSDISETNLKMTFPIHQCIREIMSCNLSGKLKVLYLQSKCIELLSLQAQAFEQSANNKSRSVLKSAYERDCIQYAETYLTTHRQKPPTLTELAKIAGINEFKLKNGFKEVFGNTVFGYLNDVRLSEAREQLLSGTTIKAISDDLGYASVQHFSTAFRKKYGLSPGKVKLN
ncbi:helix-turn-helix transcriptional regulator [Pedobacter cryoconitis]|uniref:AraC-like DNA-binding protein n=1 Tax=Pedobacter cryoconitis TaxID=188932 RepID=A0A7X0J754_9SPHI|nr:AraC family transcriptional regulator [Pedobacter cryoconitis]MBB6502208.1 AraC-like DNA-binding protein [Pedobacter cryoconitis]